MILKDKILDIICENGWTEGEHEATNEIIKVFSDFIKWIEFETSFHYADECWYCDDEKFDNIEDLYNHYLETND